VQRLGQGEIAPVGEGSLYETFPNPKILEAVQEVGVGQAYRELLREHLRSRLVDELEVVQPPEVFRALDLVS